MLRAAKYLLALAALFVISQANAQQTRAQLQTYNDTYILPCGTNCITGTIVHNDLNNIITSLGALSDINTWAFTNTFSVNPVFTSCFGPMYGNGASPITCAGAATPANPTGITVTNSSTQFQAAATFRVLVAIVNQSTTATISCAFGIPAVIGGAGSFDIPPSNTRIWNSYPVPIPAINCISSAASSPGTLEVN